ncbi:Toxin FitB [Rosistilla carotiformis]|uniref:Toxin FitB n=1 Tax=Rosistilla carotiformis TaxID=2528017 RepID=A0A518JXR1_9BACT|nr:type II toxin-antitoxin system VapC family toxin [Rosistilla carotiformis]QDV70332.1 Toxin FitB [Rosistilla carotiformis]
MFLLDTDHVSVLQRATGHSFEQLIRRLQSVPEENVFLSIVTFHERFRGWTSLIAKAKTDASVVLAYQRLRETLQEFSDVQLADFDDAAAKVFASYRSQKIRIGTMDLRIASIAIANDLTLLTRNTVDFVRVPNLRFEDWTAA